MTWALSLGAACAFLVWMYYEELEQVITERAIERVTHQFKMKNRKPIVLTKLPRESFVPVTFDVLYETPSGRIGAKIGYVNQQYTPCVEFSPMKKERLYKSLLSAQRWLTGNETLGRIVALLVKANLLEKDQLTELILKYSVEP